MGGRAYCGFGKGQPGGLFYNILPYMEQQPLHDLRQGWRRHPRPRTTAEAAMLQTPSAALICPDPPPAMCLPVVSVATFYNVGMPADNHSGRRRRLRADYAEPTAGRTARWWLCRAQPCRRGDPAKPLHRGRPYNAAPPTASLASGAQVKIADITDGTANTYLAGEKYLDPDHYDMGRSPGDDQVGLCRR